MTPHDHSTYVPGCYRCELSRDEAHHALVEERDELREALTNVVAFARAGERLTQNQQLRQIEIAALHALDA